ncbi:MAG: hypothetical protein WCD18_17700 [Thermosynechococcaceae cyanobacterium]
MSYFAEIWGDVLCDKMQNNTPFLPVRASFVGFVCWGIWLKSFLVRHLSDFIAVLISTFCRIVISGLIGDNLSYAKAFQLLKGHKESHLRSPMEMGADLLERWVFSHKIK